VNYAAAISLRQQAVCRYALPEGLPRGLEPGGPAPVWSCQRSITGSVSAEGLVEVNGHVEGDVHCTSLFISPKAAINGGVEAERVVVNGRRPELTPPGGGFFVRGRTIERAVTSAYQGNRPMADQAPPRGHIQMLKVEIGKVVALFATQV
jgi:hypothetical protein